MATILLFKISAEMALDVKGDKGKWMVGEGDQVLVVAEKGDVMNGGFAVYQCKDGSRAGYVEKGYEKMVSKCMEEMGREIVIANVVMEHGDGECTCGMKNDVIYDVERDVTDKIEKGCFDKEIYMREIDEERGLRALYALVNHYCGGQNGVGTWEKYMERFVAASKEFLAAEDILMREEIIERLELRCKRDECDNKFCKWLDMLKADRRKLSRPKEVEKLMDIKLAQYRKHAERDFGLYERYNLCRWGNKLRDATREDLEREIDFIKGWLRQISKLMFAGTTRDLGVIGMGMVEKGFTRRDMCMIAESLLVIETLRGELATRNLPPELATPEAMVYWERLEKAGYTDRYHRVRKTLSGKEKAFIAANLFEALHIDNAWKLLKGVWCEENLATYYRRLLDEEDILSFRPEVTRLFK